MPYLLFLLTAVSGTSAKSVVVRTHADVEADGEITGMDGTLPEIGDDFSFEAFHNAKMRALNQDLSEKSEAYFLPNGKVLPAGWQHGDVPQSSAAFGAGLEEEHGMRFGDDGPLGEDGPDLSEGSEDYFLPHGKVLRAGWEPGDVPEDTQGTCSCSSEEGKNAVYGFWSGDFAENAFFHSSLGGKEVDGLYFATHDAGACEDLCKKKECAVFMYHTSGGGMCALMTAQEAESIGMEDSSAWVTDAAATSGSCTCGGASFGAGLEEEHGVRFTEGPFGEIIPRRQNAFGPGSSAGDE